MRNTSDPDPSKEAPSPDAEESQEVEAGKHAYEPPRILKSMPLTRITLFSGAGGPDAGFVGGP